MREKYQGHGNHWDPFFDVNEATATEMISRELKAGALFGRWPCVDVVNGTDHQELVSAFRLGGERITNQHLAVSDSKAKKNVYFSGYPVLLNGIASRVEVEGIEPWPYGIEGWVHCAVAGGHLDITFFDTMFFAGSAGLAKGERVEVSFSALAYSLAPIETRVIHVKEGPMWETERNERLSKGESLEEASRPVELDMTQAAMFLPRGDTYPDEAEFQGVIEKFDRFEHLGVGVYRLEIVVARPDGEDWRLPVFATERVLKNGYEPRIGDAVMGIFWLQGRILELP